MRRPRAGSMRFIDPGAPRWTQAGLAFIREYRGRRLSVSRARTEDGRTVWRYAIDGAPASTEHASMLQAQKAAMATVARGRPLLQPRRRR